jgi:glucose/arabinose dehydrogenase
MPESPGSIRASLASALTTLLFCAIAAPPAGAVEVALTPFAAGLTFPVAITNAGDSRLFVVEKAGHIKIVESDGDVLATDFLDINTLVSDSGEQGLLGLAFHPDYLSNGFFYVNYTDNAGDDIVARYTVSGDPATSNVANPMSAQIVLSIDDPFPNHNGGDLHFGPDGYLYIGTGDGGGACDPFDTGQDSMALLGKMLRIDVDSGSPYAIPPTNPFAGSMTVREEIWASGLRNPFRFSFDRLNGNLYIADVGQNALEEIDFQLAASAGGENYGWDCREGNSASGCMTSAVCMPTSLFTDPVHEYDHSGGRCSVTGGYVYRGTQFPDLVGHYLFADYCTSDLYSLTTPDNGTTWNPESFGVPVADLNPTSFGEGADGEIYLGGQSSDVIYHVSVASPPPSCPITPASGCAATAKSKLKVKRPGDPAKSKLVWKWQNGPALEQTDFGDPVDGATSYALCIYGGTGAAVISGGMPGLSGWQPISTKGWKFKDTTGGSDGITKTLLKGGEAGKSKILLKAKGANLDLDALPLEEMDQLTVQLLRSDAPACWEAVFPAAAIDIDDATQLKAQIP